MAIIANLSDYTPVGVGSGSEIPVKTTDKQIDQPLKTA